MAAYSNLLLSPLPPFTPPMAEDFLKDFVGYASREAETQGMLESESCFMDLWSKNPWWEELCEQMNGLATIVEEEKVGAKVEEANHKAEKSSLNTPISTMDAEAGMPSAVTACQRQLIAAMPDQMAQSIHRSHSSHALGQLNSVTTVQSPVIAIPNLTFLPVLPSEAPSASLPDPSDSVSSIRPVFRVCSTGDLQTFDGAISSPFLRKPSISEESGMKIGLHPTSEERKIKLHRYRQKRMERNFDKKIKYACRKTLAEGRLRVKGRFARTE